MAASIHKLRTKPDKLKAQQAAEVRQAVLELQDAPAAAVAAILATIDRQTATQTGWVFVMISPVQFGDVQEWLAINSERPILAMRLWALLFRHMVMDTGEVAATRAEMAAELHSPATHVSTIMSELTRIGAVIRRREGNAVRFFVNPTVGTCLSGAERAKAQSSAPQLNLVV